MPLTDLPHRDFKHTTIRAKLRKIKIKKEKNVTIIRLEFFIGGKDSLLVAFTFLTLLIYKFHIRSMCFMYL